MGHLIKALCNKTIVLQEYPEAYSYMLPNDGGWVVLANGQEIGFGTSASRAWHNASERIRRKKEEKANASS